jgi:hypothetical protein
MDTIYPFRRPQNSLGVTIAVFLYFFKIKRSSSPVIIIFAFPFNAVPIIFTSSLSLHADVSILAGLFSW